MIPPQLNSTLLKRLQQSIPGGRLTRLRQVGKTTLARELDLGKLSHYLDLERPSDLAKLADPDLYLSRFSDQLVILDEVQRVPDLFPLLISLIDERRRAGEIKRTLSPKITLGLIESMATLKSDRAVILIPEGEPYPLSRKVTATGLLPFLNTLP